MLLGPIFSKTLLLNASQLL